MRAPIRTIIRHKYLWFVIFLIATCAWCKWGPMDPLFQSPHSTVVFDRNGELLGATVAVDGQWRMRSIATPAERPIHCLLEFEDRHFRDHFGVHIPSLIRAWQQNHRAGRTVSGGSTITMQLARMSSGAGERSYWRKTMEILKALRIELRFSKDEILAAYVANAPFGANVVGLEAAAWRWFGRSPEQLSWAESALLAILPNSPATMHPGKGRDALKAKRDRLLERLLKNGDIDELEYSLALDESLPEAPRALPWRAPHLLSTMRNQGNSGQSILTTIDGHLQDRITELADRYAPILRANEVHNGAVIVMAVSSGEVLAYVGNLPSASDAHAPDVDIIQANRSTGSLLKPFLYAAMLQQGELMPDQLVADLPTHFEGFTPKNFDQRYDGAVPASTALARSLNIPAVRALREHGIDRTLHAFRGMGLHHIDRKAEHYGLALIVGGAESSLWELTGAYASLARHVVHYGGHGSIDASVVHPPYVLSDRPAETGSSSPAPLSAAAAYHTLIALQQLNRPETEQGWQHFSGAPIAWKTGTSFGHRDAWAIGVNDKYAVGVWTGNASGEGRPGHTGTLAAAPLLFDVFRVLPEGNGFDPPYDEMERIAVCRSSGHRASTDCDPVDTIWTITTAYRTPPCPYHHTILVEQSGRFRSRPSPDARSVSWFVLPPAMEHYYERAHPGYRSLPNWPAGDHFSDGPGPMELIYPQNGTRIYVPVKLDGGHGNIVLEAAHRETGSKLYWDIDGSHKGTTLNDHTLALDLGEGSHRLTLTDQNGRKLTADFRVERGAIPIH